MSCESRAVGFDLYKNVHVRNKTAVGERRALAARVVGYGASVAYTGPVATAFDVEADEMAVKIKPRRCYRWRCSSPFA